MASILKIGGSYRAQIRITGLPSLSKTFASRDAAAAWADGEAKRLREARTSDDIFALPRFQVNREFGIYFLFRRGICVYVGQSKRPHARVHEHVGAIPFDEFSVIPCAQAKLNEVELHYIKKLNPEFNIKGAPTEAEPITRRRERIAYWRARDAAVAA